MCAPILWFSIRLMALKLIGSIKNIISYWLEGNSNLMGDPEMYHFSIWDNWQLGFYVIGEQMDCLIVAQGIFIIIVIGDLIKIQDTT